MRNSKALLGVVVIGLSAFCSAVRGQAKDAGGIPDHEQLVQASQSGSGGASWKLALRYQDEGKFQDAESAYQRAVEQMKAGDPEALANVTDCMGTMYVQMGRFDQGEQLERKALAIRQEQKDSLGIGLSWMHLAMLSLGKHDNASGEAYAELAVERLVPRNGESRATGEQKMTALTYLALARCAAHDCKDAMTPLKQAMTVAEASYSEKSFPVAYIRFLQGYVYWKRGDNRNAAKLMESGSAGMEAQLGWTHPTFVSAMQQYEGFLVATRRNVEAREVQQKLVRYAGLQTVASTGNPVPLDR
ncbi:MAG: tetratricopeptide repeat protein [Acidobacteria bacterium]|nr:tetratricopeptide repeat protein [Acidobacteriota bacterium]